MKTKSIKRNSVQKDIPTQPPATDCIPAEPPAATIDPSQTATAPTAPHSNDANECHPSIQEEFSNLLSLHRRTLFNAGEVYALFGLSKALRTECTSAGWLPVVTQGNRMTLFDLSAILKCLRRLRREGRPTKPRTTRLPTDNPSSQTL